MRGKFVAITDFSAGLVEVGDSVDMPLGAARQVSNVIPIGRRGIKRREATEAGLTFGQTIKYEFFSTSGTVPGPIAVGTSNFYDGRTTTSLGAHGLSLSTGYPPAWAEAPASGGQGPLYFQAGGVAKYVTAAGSIGTWTASTGTLPLTGSNVMAFHGNRMWVADVSGNQSRLYFSEINDPRIWSGGTAGYVDIDPSSGGGITAICPCGPYLMVFKGGRLYSVYNLDTGANREIASVGTNHGGAVQGRYGTVYFTDSFLYPGNVYRTDGSTVQSISEQLDVRYGLPVYSGGVLMLYTPNTTLMDVYLEELGSWWQVALPTGSGAFIGNHQTARKFYLANGSSTPSTWSVDDISPAPTAGNDASGSTIEAFWWGGDQDFGAPGLRKRFRQMDIEGDVLNGAAVTKDCATDEPTTTALTYRGTGVVKSARLPGQGVAHYFAPFLYDTSGGAWQIRSLTMAVQLRKN